MTGAFLAALTARLRRELEAADAARAAETKKVASCSPCRRTRGDEPKEV
jgi:hypothetical protein